MKCASVYLHVYFIENYKYIYKLYKHSPTVYDIVVLISTFHVFAPDDLYC